MRARGGRQYTRPSLFADDFLEADERAYFGDDVALDIAVERHTEASRRYVAPDIDPDVDLLAGRPDDLDAARTDDVAVEVMSWRAAVLDGRPLAWRTKGGKR